MAVFDFNFVFCCPRFVADIHQAIERSTKNYEIAAHVSGNHVVKNFEVDYFKMKSQFLPVVLIIIGTVCITIPKIVLITIGGFIFECVMKVVVSRLKSAINVIGEVLGGFGSIIWGLSAKKRWRLIL